jgi:hypothetical protein
VDRKKTLEIIKSAAVKLIELDAQWSMSIVKLIELDAQWSMSIVKLIELDDQ